MRKSKRVKTYVNHATADAPKPRKGRGLWAIFLFCLIAAVCGFGAWQYVQKTFVADGPVAQDTIFTVPRGAGVSTIASRLEADGLIEDARMFKLFVRLEGDETGLKAGEYTIKAKNSIVDIYTILSDGQAILYPFTAPEGLTSAQIMRSMARLDTLIKDEPDIPAEGTLLPETYLTPRGMTQSALIKQMRDDQKKVLDEAWANRQEGLPIKTKEEAIILASIVEKETGITSERDRVAGVFINRLNKGMRLESDPTIIYGITQGEPLWRGIRRSEIDRKTDWNTYQIDGLPKTPICNPGKDAILAVLNPAETKDIFFVADGTGGHVFAQTLREHNNNVAKWRKIERKLKKEQAKKKKASRGE